MARHSNPLAVEEGNLMKHQPLVVRTVCVILPFWVACGTSSAADWPTFGGDNHRSGVTDQRLALPLTEVWVHRTQAPRPAWPDPAKQDFWHNTSALTPSVVFDRALHVAVADGAVYFGSSADDKITCLDAATGRVRWTFFTEGPVRLAPAVTGGKVYAGSDDGSAYCLAAEDGEPVWQYRPAPVDRRIPGNGRMISAWPVRCGVLVDGGTAYLCAGLFPTYGVYLCALDANDGTERWKRRLDGVSPQGYLLASDTRLYVPSGRTTPAVFDRRDGRPLGTLHGNARGGSYALLIDELAVYRGEKEASLSVSDRKTGERLVLFKGSHLVVRGGTAYLHSQRELAALDRTKYLQLARQRNQLTARKNDLEERLKKLGKPPDPVRAKELSQELKEVEQRLGEVARAMNACWKWRRPCAYPHALVLAGDTLLVGGDGQVAALRTTDGGTEWRGEVRGKAYGLAVAAGRLFVSTDEGAIHCFQ